MKTFSIGKLTFRSNDELPQGSPEWLMERRKLVTASNAHIVLTRGKNAALLNNARPHFDNQYTDRGHALENEVKHIINSQLSKEYQLLEVGMIKSTDYEGCGYSPDGVVLRFEAGEPVELIGLVEIKSYNDVTERQGKKVIVNKHLKACQDMVNIPVEARAQCQFALMITDMPEIQLVLYNPDCVDPQYKIKVWTIKRDERIISKLKEKLK